MDSVAKARLQVRLVVVMYRQHRDRAGADGMAAYRQRALPLLAAVELAHGDHPEIAQLLAAARRELDGAGA